ncbi:Protein kinase domain [Macleaya cordata]|uniref:non-specific serine/threonine protein kinase n=1 Tax=Macleaya cordata TaxID=56857 RepID=A0A200Q7X5_MACCD|nr:Protein kinase domain [Macleaya cordata]
MFNSLYFIINLSLIVSAKNEVRISNDRLSLLKFKSGIVSDPGNVLESWNSSKQVCNWTGIGCNDELNRVVQLDLSGKSLRGTISPAISNLSFLLVLDLSGNYFSGRIPPEIGRLVWLKQLSLSSNLLEGEIPAEFGYLTKLVYLDLGSNRLVGQIPVPLLCNGSSAIEYIDLSNNSLNGEIPLLNHCELNELKFLLLWSNKLVGQIPISLSKSSKLQWLDLESNSLTGELPLEIVHKMTELQFLYLSYNGFTSHNGNTDLRPFISSLVNCSNLQELELAGNNLGGEIPTTIGNLSTNLLQLHLGENHIFGPIPPSISNLVNLTLLNLSSNLLNGSIPIELCRMKKLERVFLSNNSLSGEIPSAFGDVPHLGLLDLSINKLSGSIPETLSNLTQLRRLLLYENQLSGTIPPSLGKCINLEILDLSRNRISGSIPNQVAGLRSLKLYLNLSSNFLQGSIPLELSKMDMVLAIDLSLNQLKGEIPAQLVSCIALEYLNLSFNDLQSPLPIQIGNLPYLQVLDVSSNKLFGELPQFLQENSNLKQLNVSFNNFSGIVPHDGVFSSLTLDSLQGNPNLCGFISGLPTCRKKKQTHNSVILPIIITLSAIPVICLFGLIKVRAKRRSSSAIFGSGVLNEEQDNKHPNYPKISYRQLVEATNGFNGSNLVGSGRFGHVYKGILRDDTRVAVKVLDPKIGGEISRSFKRECQVLKRTRHRNLIRIITTCSKPDFNALVFPLMPKGSLESHLYPGIDDGLNNRCCLSLFQLVSICSDVAEGVAYLHHDSPVRVIHCDLKPSNILLDEDMTALVTDFGISRLVKDGGGGVGESNAAFDMSMPSCDSTTGLLCGSLGYIAPEYGLGRNVSTHGDVYSFGVLLLEILTGKRPTDVLFHQGSTLHEWVKSHYPYKLDAVVKQSLLSSPSPVITANSIKVRQDVIFEMIELGIMCTQYSPSLRPSMINVAQEMSWLKQITGLDLKGKSLQGTLSPFLCNLSSLKQLDLSENSFRGPIPVEFGALTSLEELSLRSNEIQYEVPESFGQLIKLRFIDLSSNQLGGKLPHSLFHNCSALVYIDLSDNMFVGFIPSQIGNNLNYLETLRLYLNQLSGMIPASLSNSSQMKELDLEYNFLTDTLPSKIVKQMPLLEILYLSGNYLESDDDNTNLTPFFTAISNLTHLQELHLAENMLGGEFPSVIGTFNTNLSEIRLEDNFIHGAIPLHIANFSSVTLLNLSSNLLNGKIPSEISLLPKLERLSLSNNSLEGEIPSSLGDLSHLGLLDLSRNKLSGSIPSSLANLTQLRILHIHENLLSGTIPSSLGRCINLDILDFSYNMLSGEIPSEVAGLREIGMYFNLSNNFLSGELPMELSKMEMIRAIDLSSNNFNGEIPSNLVSCEAAEMINLSYNSLQGSIPTSLGNLLSLHILDLSHNLLSGEIPASFSKSTSLVQLNLSFNNLSGSIPRGGLFDSLTFESFQGNSHLCWQLTELQNCNPNKGSALHSLKFLILIVCTVSTSVFVLTVFSGLVIKVIKRFRSISKTRTSSKFSLALRSSHPRITYREIQEATKGFEQSRLIGSGSFGHVYKGVLTDRTVVAVKVLRFQSGNSTKSFDRECQILKRIRHRNLMRIITACSLPEFKALVLPFMANGSLDSHLYPKSPNSVSPLDLSLITRVNICSDIAEGLAYLHHHSPVQVIHCDLKPSNILLNNDMTAFVSDFGIAKLVSKVGEVNTTEKMTKSTVNLLCGSIGYIAPEYGLGRSASAKGDIYSFGVLVLEMVTRKRPTDDLFNEGMNLPKWVKNHYHGNMEEIIDPTLMRAASDQSSEVKNMWEVAIIELIELGLLCTQETPSTRPTMIDAADDLDRLKRYLCGDTTMTFTSSIGISFSTVTGGNKE